MGVDRTPDFYGEDREWLDYPSKCEQCYDQLNYTGLAGFFLSKSHSIAERHFTEKDRFDTVLEVGAGSGRHIRYVRHSFQEYILADSNEEFIKATAKRLEELHPHKIRVRVEDCSKLQCADESVDRLIATHVLEHLYQPHTILKEWYRVLKRGGVMTIVLPCDPGLAWRLGRIAARKKAKRLGYSYDYIMAREHVNPINNLVEFIRYYFSKREEIWWPFGIPSMDLNVYYACHVFKECW